MRTSGAPTEGRMTVAILLVCLAIAMLLAGGPREFVIVCENWVRWIAKAVYEGVQSFAR
jgi:hypothetical protein